MASSSLFGTGTSSSAGSSMGSDHGSIPSPPIGSESPPTDSSLGHDMKSTIKIAMVQLNPYHKQPEKTLDHLNSLLSSCFPSLCTSPSPTSASAPSATIDPPPPPAIDILMLPEMTLTGYTFTSPQDIHPYAEPAGPEGRTTAWCMRTARQLRCWVVAGFPCLAADGKYYNAMVLVDRAGQVVTTYFKHFLFTQDELWATPGPSFKAITDIAEFGTLALGICMDLNPYRFEAPFDLCEFGRFCVSKQTRLVLCSMAWLRSKSGSEEMEDREEVEEVEQEEESAEEAHSLLSYWAYRLRPLDGTGCLVAICNRVGKETATDGEGGHTPTSTEFAGHSCVMQLSGGPKSREMEVTHVGKKEGVYVIEADFDWVQPQADSACQSDEAVA